MERSIQGLPTNTAAVVTLKRSPPLALLSPPWKSACCQLCELLVFLIESIILVILSL